MSFSWERHPDEGDHAYKFFFEYYLPHTLEDPKATLIEAWKRWMYAEENILPEFLTTRNVPKKFIYWAEGKDYRGNPIAGLKSFKERAQDYAIHFREKYMEAIENRQRVVLDVETDDSKSLHRVYNKIFNKFETYVNEHIEEIENPRQLILTLQRLVETREGIGRIMRNGAIMPQQHKEEVAITKVEKVDNEIRVVFEELDNSNRQREAVDKLSNDDFEKLLFNDLEQIND